jgi:hypothetical protein
MGPRIVEVDHVLSSQRVEVPIIEQQNVIEHLRTLSWWRSTAFSTTSSCRGRHASAAIPASSLPELRRSSFDQSRRTARRTHFVIREIESNLISLFDHEQPLKLPIISNSNCGSARMREVASTGIRCAIPP